MQQPKITPPQQVDHFTPRVEKETSYSKLLQGKATNALAHVSKRGITPNPITGMGDITTAEGVDISFKNFNGIVLNVPTHKVLDALTIKLSNNFPYGENVSAETIDRHRNVELSIDEYMGLCQIKDPKEARQQLKNAVLTLYDVSLEWDEIRYTTPEGKKKRKKEATHWKARIIDMAGSDIGQDPIKHGKVSVKFTFDIAKYFSQAFIMPYPDKLLSINAKYNPHSYYIGRKMAEHHNMNIGKDNSNRIAVKTLLDCLPDLPKYDEIMDAARQVTKRIIMPFERDLIALKDTYGIITSWRYCNKNGEPLADEQIVSYSYDTWTQWLIEFELASYPAQGERLAAISTRKRAAKKRRAAAKDKETQPKAEHEEPLKEGV